MKQERHSLSYEVRLARIVVGIVLGILISSVTLIGNAIAGEPAVANAPQITWINRTLVVEELATRFTEKPTQIGLTAEGAVLELFAAADGDTWTLVLTLPTGKSRVVATGESWMAVPAPVKGRRS